MKIRSITIMSFLLLSFVMAKSQDIDISSQQTLGNIDHNFTYSILPLSGGGYILLADTETDSMSMDYLLIKVLADGQIDWQKTFGGEAVERPSQIITDNDGGFYVIGSSSSSQGDFSNNHGLFDVWLTRFSLAGKLLWQRNYGGSGIDFGIDIKLKQNGNFLIGASTTSGDGDVSENKGMTDFWLLELAPDGDIIWEKTYGGSENEYFDNFFIDEYDSIFMLGGTKSVDGDISFNHGNKDVWLVKTDNQGYLLWEKTYGGSDSDEGKCIRKSHNGNVILTAISRSDDGDITKSFGLNDFWVLEVDKNSDLLWQRSFGGSKNDVPKDMLLTDDGYLIGGTTYSFDGNITENKGRGDVWMLKIYKDGVINWQKTFGGSGVESCTKIVYSENANYLSSNNTDSFDFDIDESIGKTDAWMLDLCETFAPRDNISICEGDSILWENNYYGESGVYTESFQSKCGLDSIRKLVLEVIEVPGLNSISGPSLVTEFTAEVYFVDDYEGLQYFWEVENGTFKDSVFLSHNQVVWHGSGNGLLSAYAIKKQQCSTDTVFLDVYVSGVGVGENPDKLVSVYPNPSKSGLFYINSDKKFDYELISQFGVKLSEGYYSPGSQLTIDISRYPKSIYYLGISMENKVVFKKLIH
ncbi:MAG: T9SS type A sorting domain-containing protein [Chlorobi bacterium]|nr:T9SS type A sorting domain-containing protein [Chlorobiota bacterium]